MIIGFDLDGVICDYLPWLVNEIEDEANRRMFYIDREVIVDPSAFAADDDKIIIICDRPTIYRDVTEEWLKEHGITYPVFFVGNKHTELLPRHSAMKKASIIKEHNIEVFFDDNKEAVEILREMTDAKIIYVKTHLDFEKWKY